jgi:hypothetical protein
MKAFTGSINPIFQQISTGVCDELPFISYKEVKTPFSISYRITAETTKKNLSILIS